MSNAQKTPPSELRQPAASMPQVFLANVQFAPAMVHFAQSYGEGFSQLAQEILNFASKRLYKNVATVQAICGCKEMDEARRIQQDWIERTTMDYADHMGNLFNLTLRVTAEAFRPVGEQGKAGVDAEKSAK
jgi:hypothetical protein